MTRVGSPSSYICINACTTIDWNNRAKRFTYEIEFFFLKKPSVFLLMKKKQLKSQKYPFLPHAGNSGQWARGLLGYYGIFGIT